MEKFNDAKGNEWVIKINIGTAMQVRDRIGVDILQPEKGTPPLATELKSDTYLLPKILFVLLENQCEQRGLTDKDMYEYFSGTVLQGAENAFWKELTHFFSENGRMDRAKLINRIQAIEQASIKAFINKAKDKTEDEMIQFMEKRIEEEREQSGNIYGELLGF